MRQHYNADAFFTSVPLLEINETVTITAGTTEVPLTARYMSAAILFDLAEVQDIRIKSQTGSNFDLPFATGGGLGAVFFTGVIEDKVCLINVTGKDGYKNASIQINTDGSSGANKIEAGKYYFLRLAAPDASAAFSFKAMDWTDGGTLI